MERNYSFIIFLILVITFLSFSSCTLEKRVYMNGYHVDWNKRKPKIERQNNIIKNENNQQFISENNVENEEINSDFSETNFTASADIETNIILPKKNILTQEQPVSKDNHTEKSFTSSDKKQIKKNRIDDDLPVLDEPSRRIDGIGLAGFIVSIASWFLPALLGLPAAILALVFGVISLSRINRNPRAYKGRGFAIAGIIIGLVALMILLLMIL